MNFGSLKQFLLFKIIGKTIKFRAQYWAETGPRLQPTRRGGLLRAVGRKASGANGLRGPLQRARAARAPARSPRADHAWDSAVSLSPVARRWLDGGKVSPVRRRARRVETGLTKTVGLRWGGRKRPARRCSTAAGSLQWSSTCVEGSCSTSVEGEEKFSSNLGTAKLGGRSPERGKTVAALDKIRRGGETSGGRGRRYRHGSSGEGGDAQEGGRSGVGDEGVDERFGHVRAARSAARPASGAPIVSWPAVTRTRRARAARHGSDSGALALMRGPRLSAGEGVRRERRGARGLAREGKGWAEPR
jgi:hypothetical protein